MKREIAFWLLVILFFSTAFAIGASTAFAGICEEEAKEQVAKGAGRETHCFDLSSMDRGIQLNPIRSSPNIEVESWFGTDEMGYNKIDEQGKIHQNVWRNNVQGVLG